MDNWRLVTAAEVAASHPNALATGPFGSAISARFFRPSGIPVIRGSNLSESTGERLIEHGMVFVSSEKAREFSRSIARRGDLVFTCWGTIGQVGLIDKHALFDEYIVSNKQMKLTPDPAKADSLFLYYCFSGPKVSSSIISQAIGSSVPGFNLGQLKEIRLRLPPLDEQRAIAGVLGILDDKIKLNQRMNETLERMARTLFKSWFVDFDPVHAKMAGCPPFGMDAATAMRFPDRLVESTQGPIPSGWQIVPLSDILELKRGYDLPTTDRRPGSVPIISSSGSSGYHDESKVHGPGVVTGRYGTIGQVFLVWDDFWPLNTALYIKDFRDSDPLYALYILRGLDFQKFSDKGAVPGINRNHVHIELVCRAPVLVQHRFSEMIRPWLSLVRQNEQQSETLANVRDVLLPRLLSGELRVRDAERKVGKVA